MTLSDIYRQAFEDEEAKKLEAEPEVIDPYNAVIRRRDMRPKKGWPEPPSVSPSAQQATDELLNSLDSSMPGHSCPRKR